MKEFTRKIKEFTIKYIKDSEGNMFLTNVLKENETVYEFVNEENEISPEESYKKHNENVINLLKYKYDIINQYLEGDNNKTNSIMTCVGGIVATVICFILSAPIVSTVTMLVVISILFSILRDAYKGHEEKMDLDIIEHTIDHELEQINRLELVLEYGKEKADEMIKQNKIKVEEEKKSKQSIFPHRETYETDYSYFDVDDEDEESYQKRITRRG